MVQTATVGGLWTDELLAAYGEYVKTARAVVARAGQHPALGEERTSDDLAHAFLYQQLGTFHTPPFIAVAKALAATRHPHADLRALGIPTLMVTGSADPIFAADHVRDVAGRIDAELVEIDGGGHSPYWEQPAEYNAILKWIEQGAKP